MRQAKKWLIKLPTATLDFYGRFIERNTMFVNETRNLLYLDIMKKIIEPLS